MDSFIFRGKSYSYFDHPGNQTRVNERRMELPLAFEFVESHKESLLEVGNVTRHYHREFGHDVVDLFEQSKWPIFNEDILAFNPKEKNKAVLSVSTVEHTVDPRGAINKIVSLSPVYFITMPLGYSSNNGVLDLPFPMYFMKRVCLEDNHWEEGTKEDASKASYGSPYPFANVVVVITNT